MYTHIYIYIHMYAAEVFLGRIDPSRASHPATGGPDVRAALRQLIVVIIIIIISIIVIMTTIIIMITVITIITIVINYYC